MKVHSLTILHYGADYLSSALRSIYHSVDQCHIFYTPTPSHGHSTNIPPIETREELRQAAYAYDPDYKVKWYDMHGIKFEGNQRDLALATVEADGADIVVVVDCDEIWHSEVLKVSLEYVKYFSQHRDNLVNMTHLWRSFNWACYDNGWPVRFINLTKPKTSEVEYLPTGGPFHFGYAVTDRIMNYKWQIHGHKNELRPDWLGTYWTAWPPIENCHPTNGRNEEGKPFWIPEPFDKDKLPEFMRQHPFWGLDKIE
jgi:hypothetical protein